MDIDKITLQYLSNSKNKTKLNNTTTNKLSIDEDDLHFYKHRIQNITHELLTNPELCTMDVDLKQSFMIYINTCIKYFKLSDTNTIIQQDHLDLCNIAHLHNYINKENESYNDSYITPQSDIISDMDNQMTTNGQLNSKQITYNIDNFIIRNKPNKKLIPPIIIPKQKEININTTDLRYKIDIPTIVNDNLTLDIILPQHYFEVIMN
jgi:hypothetical protein